MKNVTKKQVKVASEWVNGKITQSEASRRLGKTFVGGYITLALILKHVLNEKKWEED